jgi:hypothetical protein
MLRGALMCYTQDAEHLWHCCPHVGHSSADADLNIEARAVLSATSRL